MSTTGRRSYAIASSHLAGDVGDAAAKQTRRSIWSGVLAGVGLVAFIDETVFHQLLHWHHFYDQSTPVVGLVSDGLFHAGGFIAMVAGLFLLADAHRRGGFVPKRWWGGLLLGAGGFQLYDGIVQHKLLGLHQIRYHVTIWPYDLIWNIIAFLMIVAGVLLMTGEAGIARSSLLRPHARPAGLAMLELIPLAMTLAALAGYRTGLHRLRRRGVRWPVTRVAAILTGSLCVAAAVLPPIASHDELFPVHVGQHLLLGMAAPAFLALSAPVTLALRTLPRRPRRILLRLLHSFPVAVLVAPATAVVLDLGGLYALYLTGLYQAAEHDDLVHAAVHMHMFLAGCLLSWALIGVDPVRRRPDTGIRLTVLIIAGAGHDTLAKLIYARKLPAGGGSIVSRHTGAELMYYGGTVIEVGLAAIVMAQWYLVSGRALVRTRRRSQSAGPQPPIALPSRRRGSAPLPLSHLGRISRNARTGHKRTPTAQ